VRKRRLKIRSSYEPNRLGKAYLLDAYAKLIPIIKHPINFIKEPSQNVKEDQLLLTLRNDTRWKR